MAYLPTNLDQQQLMDRIRNSSDIAFLSLDEHRNVRILHHFEELPGSILQPNETQWVCLAGLSGAIQMIAPAKADMLRPAVTINTPAYTNFKTCTTSEQIIALQASNHANQAITSGSLIPLPPKLLPFLAELLATKGTSPTNILPGLIRAFVASDADNISDEGKLGKRAIEILKFLWAADKSNDTNKQIPTVAATCPTHPSIDDYFQRCTRKLNPAPQQAVQPHRPPLRPEEERVLLSQERSSTAIIEMAELYRADQLRKAQTEASKPKSGYDGLYEPIKVMILRASATTKEAAADEPTITMKNVINSSNAFEATKAIELEHDHSTSLSIPPPMAAKLRQGTLASDCGRTPSGLSIFFCFEDEHVDRSEHVDVDAMSLEISESKEKTMSKTTAKSLANEKAYISFPRSFFQLRDGVERYHHLCTTLLGQDAIFTKEIECWIDHMKRHSVFYNQATMPNLCISIASLIERGWQVFIASCLRAKDLDDVNFSAIDFSVQRQYIIMGIFSFNIPADLLKLDPLSSSKPSSSGKRKRDDVYAPSDTDPVYNQQHKSTPVIENWGEFLTEQNQHDTLRGICSNWHVRGKCIRNCPHKASHTYLVEPAASEFRKIVDKHSK